MKNIKLLCLSVITFLSFFFTVSMVNAASLSLNESLSTTSTVVGNTITVTVRMSSTTPLGYINYSMNYDTSKLTLTSGTQNNVLYSFTGSEKSTTVTFKFKAKAKGSATVSLKINEALDFDGNNLSGTKSVSRTINIKTQAEIEASYSKNNNLSKLNVNSGTLSPAFNKNTLSYGVEVPYEVTKITISGSKEDSKSYVDGFKTYELEEGINKINIKVTAQNGSSKVYVINVTRKELTPIVVDVLGVNYNVVRKKDLIEKPNSNYEETTIKINDIDVPAFVNETTNTTLVGLKDSDGNIELYVYENDTYKLYREFTFDSIIITESLEKDIPEGYQKTNIKIGDKELVAYRENDSSDYYLFNGININTGEDNLYQYNKKENTIQIFNKKMLTKINELEDKENNYMYVIFGLGGALIITYLSILISSIKKVRKSRKRKVNEEIVKNEVKDEEIEGEIEKKIEKDDRIKEDVSKKRKVKKK